MQHHEQVKAGGGTSQTHLLYWQDCQSLQEAPLKGLRLMVDLERKFLGIPGIFKFDKVIRQTPTGAIVLVSCDDEARTKWEEISNEGKLSLRISGTGMVVFQERAKAKKTLIQKGQKAWKNLTWQKNEDCPAPAIGNSGGKPEATVPMDTS